MARGCEPHHAFDIVGVGVPITVTVAVAIAFALSVTLCFAVPLSHQGR